MECEKDVGVRVVDCSLMSVKKMLGKVVDNSLGVPFWGLAACVMTSSVSPRSCVSLRDIARSRQSGFGSTDHSYGRLRT